MTQKKKIKVEVASEDPKVEPKKSDEIESKAAKTESDELEDLETRLKAAETEAKESYDRLLRASADLENYKKRTQREMSEFRKYANESLIKEILGVVDNLERAVNVANGGDNEKTITKGVDLTLKELLSIIKKYQVEPIESLGKSFDPNFHQAMMQEEAADHPANTVIKELQKGYMIHDRLLRPAMVVVSKAPNEPLSNADNDQEEITQKDE
jgi:molecular chaperone GrpE